MLPEVCEMLLLMSMLFRTQWECCHMLPWAAMGCHSFGAANLHIKLSLPRLCFLDLRADNFGEINGAVQNSKANKRRRDAIVTRQMSILKCPFSSHRDATIPQANNRGTSSVIRRLLWLRCLVAQWYSSCMMLMPTAALEAESSHMESFFPRFQSSKSPKWSTTMHRKGIDRSKGCRHLFWV